MSKALVVFSGGQDSTTCLFWAKSKFDEVEAVAFDYGQKHRNELDVAAKIAKQAAVPLAIYPLNVLGQLSRNALTDSSLEVEAEKPADRPPNTLVEGRNMLFLTYAAILAKGKGISNLITGVGQADYSGYPDCRDEFIRSLNQTLNLSMDYQYQIHTPLMWKSKAEVWQLADELGVFDLVRAETLTCYNGVPGDGCGACPACKLRNNGLDTYLKIRATGDAKLP